MPVPEKSGTSRLGADDRVVEDQRKRSEKMKTRRLRKARSSS